MFDVTRSPISRASTASSKSSRSSIASSLYHKKDSSFKETVHEYASSSSAHGIVYIFEPGRLRLERLLWFVIVGFALIFRLEKLTNMLMTSKDVLFT